MLHKEEKNSCHSLTFLEESRKMDARLKHSGMTTLLGAISTLRNIN